MKSRSFLTRKTGLFSLLPLSRSDAAQSQGATRAAGGCGPASLPFRAILAGHGDPRNRTSDFWQRETWNSRLQRWNREGFNVVVWMGANELLNSRHALARLEE